MAAENIIPPAVTAIEKASLYVGDLDWSVTDEELKEIFSRVGTVDTVKICRNQFRPGLSLGYGYVNYHKPQDAAKALAILNFYPINGKPVRVMYSNRDPTLRKSGFANVFVKNLESSIDNKALFDVFASFGTILSCKVAVDSNGLSKGYGFVQFEAEESAQKAIEEMNGLCLNDKEVYVGPFVRRQDRPGANGSPTFTNVYVKNLSETVGDEDLKEIFSPLGAITSCVVMRDREGNSKGFGFVNFQSPEEAVAAVEKLNGAAKDDMVLFVGRAQRRADRDAELRSKFEQERIDRYDKMLGANLYLKHLDDFLDDEKLMELFSEFGTVTSAKVMVDSRGLSKGSGFVSFSSPEEAARALKEMNGKMIGRKPLYVAIAQRKEARRVHLAVQFAQMRATGAMGPLPSGIPGFHPAAPRLGPPPPPMYYGQGNPGILPPQPPGLGYQQPVLPGMRSVVAPNYVIPYHLQRPGPPGQHMAMRRVGNLPQLQQQPPPLLHRNPIQGARYMPNSRNGMGPMASVFPLPLDGSIPASPINVPRPAPVPMAALASALASATPENQRLMLGEQLFPLVERLQPGYTSKVTGMLLEMDQPEVLHLIESPEALKDKVAEAMAVLQKSAAKTDNANQLGSLATNE